MKDKVFQKDFYCVYNDYNVSLRTTELNLLYLPLVGSDAVKLYQFLGSKMIGDTNLSKNYLHYDIFDNLALDVNKFIIARKKLEAIGLLQSFYINNSIILFPQNVLLYIFLYFLSQFLNSTFLLYLHPFEIFYQYLLIHL